MKKALKIARFEFVEKAKTKSYITFVLLFPVIICAVSILPVILASSKNERQVVIGILDYTNSLGSEFAKKLNEYKLGNGLQKYLIIDLYKDGSSYSKMINEADKAVSEKIISGYLLIENDHSAVHASFMQSDLSEFNELYQIEKTLNQALVQQRLQQFGYKAAIIENIVQAIKLDAVRINNKQDSGSNALKNVFIPAVVSMLLLFMLILFSGGQMIRSLMEEKSNRIMEVLLSSCSAKELLTGKVIGLGMLGLFQIIIWALAAVLMLTFRIIPAEIFSNIGLITVYFVLGYLFYTAIFVGAGSVVTTEQEAQHFTSYISLIMTVPLVISLKVIENPDLLFVRILSFLPLTSPPVMLIRLKVHTPPAWEVFLTMLILIISIYVTIYISSKIFRIGILSYGKRPSLREIIQWTRER